MRRMLAVLALATMIVAGCSSDETSTTSGEGTAGSSVAESSAPASTATPYRSEIYDDPDNWLCLPDRAGDACDQDLDTTVVEADGTKAVEMHQPATDPPIDCFYVYPTISGDKAFNSDLEAGPEERATVLSQAARLTSQCRVFAPVYRQVTLAVITGGGAGFEGDRAQAGVTAYNDVADAWKWYRANENDGRGVVLIGHSQGSGHLTQLIQKEIDGDEPSRDLLVGAYLLGSSVAVPSGEVVGGAFQNVPLCRAADEIGCVVTYATFRSTAPPPDNSFFGRPRSGEGTAGCVNPAAPGGTSELHSYFPSSAANDPTVTTPFVSFPGLVTATCVEAGGFSYLEATVQSDPADARVDDIPGDLTPQWGLHLVDVNIALGDIIEMVSRQVGSYDR